jgi:glycosyltransferase involved in cell wall biosynthesis
MADNIFCSIIIPTVGRVSLNQAVESVLAQSTSAGAYEIIVVNDSGQPLFDAAWQQAPCVRIIATNRRERCFARNIGAAMARGRYFCFLDDDDWLLPDALENFGHLASRHPTAVWLYGGVEFVDGKGQKLGYLNMGKSGNCFVEAAAETWIPIQASLIQADAFFAVGGFDPQFPVTQDLHLLRCIALRNDWVHMPVCVACIRRGVERGSLTNTAGALPYIRLGRKLILQESGSFHRLIDSAGRSPFLRGVVLRIYGAGLMDSLRRRDWATVLSRGWYIGLSLGVSLPYLFSGDYWRSVRRFKPLHHDLIVERAPEYNSVTEWLH